MIYIYEHFYIKPNGDEVVFYIGRTQHKRHAKLTTHKTANWHYHFKFHCDPDNFSRIIEKYPEDSYNDAVKFQTGWINILKKKKHPITNSTIRKKNKNSTKTKARKAIKKPTLIINKITLQSSKGKNMTNKDMTHTQEQEFQTKIDQLQQLIKNKPISEKEKAESQELINKINKHITKIRSKRFFQDLRNFS